MASNLFVRSSGFVAETGLYEWHDAMVRATGRLGGDVGKRFFRIYGSCAWDRLVSILGAVGPCARGMSCTWDASFDAALALAVDVGDDDIVAGAPWSVWAGRGFGASDAAAVGAAIGDCGFAAGRQGNCIGEGAGLGDCAQALVTGVAVAGASAEQVLQCEDVSGVGLECASAGSSKVGFDIDGHGGSGGVCAVARDTSSVGVDSAFDGERLVRDEVRASVAGCEDGLLVRGKHFERNRARRERARRAKLASADWRAAGSPRGGSLPSLAGTVCTVDTRTADEVEAANTLARRRVAENKLAEIRANRLIASYADVDKTAAIEKLQVVRLEERINTAKAKSQASYKKCDESLKSLGSTGSAGEFALKKQIKDTKKLEARLQYVHDQFAAVYPFLSQEAIDKANAVPEPKFPTDFEVFGDCPADYTEEEREAYYLDMNIEAGEIF